jgi:hypothetical protein
MLGERSGEACLADARIPQHELHPTLSAGGVLERVVQLTQLTYAAYERSLTRSGNSRTHLLLRQSASKFGSFDSSACGVNAAHRQI